jgi:hypothetical protein
MWPKENEKTEAMRIWEKYNQIQSEEKGQTVN